MLKELFTKVTIKPVATDIGIVYFRGQCMKDTLKLRDMEPSKRGVAAVALTLCEQNGTLIFDTVEDFLECETDIVNKLVEAFVSLLPDVETVEKNSEIAQ